MSRLLAVAARELRERWLLFPGAVASGCFPLVLPAFGVEREVMPVVGSVGAVLLGLGAAVVIGSSMLARDASNGRLGFLFSRPVPWPAIWGGKWLAALVLVAATGLLAAIPWMAVYPLASVGGHHGDSWLRAMLDGPRSVFFLTLAVFAVGLANFNATAFRSRSPWVSFDLLLLMGGIWATRQFVAPLWRYGILGQANRTVALALVPLAAGFLVGSVAQVAVGRTDLRRAHRALSLGFWAVAAATLAVAAGHWAWVLSAGPADVDVRAISRDPAGRWVYVEGSTPRGGWYPHGLLLDTASGRYVTRREPDPERERFGVGMLFSGDGRFAALPKIDRDGRNAAIDLFDLTGGTPRAVEVVLESSPPPTWKTAFALSPAAAVVFVAHESGASLFALPSGRRVATTTIPPGWHPAAVRFPAEGTARAWLVPDGPGVTGGQAGPRAEMRVVDLAVGGATKTATFPIATPLDAAPAWRTVFPDADGRRIVTVDAGLHLRDGATGGLVATLVDGVGHFPVLFLADGRVVVGDSRVGEGEPGSPRALVRVFDPIGAPTGEIRLDLPPGGLNIGPEVAPGRVVVSSLRAAFLSEDTLVVDAGESRVVERLAGLRPAAGFWGVSGSAPSGASAPRVHFFRDASGQVLRLDFATGERRVVAGTGAPAGERISGR